jgi:FkbM family methyltransferase
MSAWRCPKCGFVQGYLTMRASDGAIGENRGPAIKLCPNDDTELYEMRIVEGISLPLGDTHFAEHLAKGPAFKGKGSYQFAKIEAALAVVPPDRRGLALDVGAHIGLWSRVLAYSFARVIAFEPLPALHPHFMHNTDDVQNITFIPCAVGAECGELDIITVVDNSGNGHVAPAGVPGAFIARVEAVTIDSLNLHDVNFIKIDVEGFELPVIEGGQRTIRRDKPVMVVEQKPNNAERYGRGRLAAVELLQSWGYEIAWERSGDFCLT